MDAETQIIHRYHWKDSLVLTELIQASNAHGQIRVHLVALFEL